MTDQPLDSAGNVRIGWLPVNGVANPGWATVAELNAGLQIEDLIDLGDYTAFVEASDTETTNPMGKKNPVEIRSSSQYGGSLTIGYPGYKADMQNLAALAYAIFKAIRVEGYLYWSIDGEIGEAGQATKAFANGDYYSMIKTWAGAWDDQITGEEAFKYTRSLFRGGGIWLNRVVSTTLPVLTLTATNGTGSVGDFATLEATANGRNITRGVRYTTDDPTVATVSRNGVVTMVDVGPAVITATLPDTTPTITATASITVS